jgi:hypothetical protein
VADDVNLIIFADIVKGLEAKMFGKKGGGVKLFVIARRSGNRRLLIDSAYRVTDKRKGTDVYKLKKMKETIRPIEYENIVQNNEGNFAPCFSPAKGEFYPMYLDETYTAFAEIPELVLDAEGKPVKNEDGTPKFEKRRVEVRGRIEPVNEDQKAFFYNENMKAFQRFKKGDFWEKYGALISVLVTGIALGLVFLFWSQAAAEMAKENAASLNVLKQITQAVSGASNLVPAAP